MKLQNTYDVGVYCRLSRDDNNGNLVSMSIENQRQMLTDYVKEKGWNLREIYIDDGYTGTNFDRPDFKRMIADAEAGKINCIITKDLSRLGRNYVKTGYYTEELFVEMNIRFIAVNDSIDTLNDNNDIAPFQNILNEWYPKEVSKKVRQVKKSSARQGKFMGSQAPYGYMKSPQDKHQLIIDEPAATIIRRIFNEYAVGESARRIAERLNEEGLDSPRFYHYAKMGRVNPLSKEKNYWNSTTVNQLMKNQVYIGHMVQGKRQVVSFKTKRRSSIDQEDWIVVENTHEPIISRDIWGRVQRRFEQRGHHEQRVRRTGELSLFSGILRCADCGTKLAYSDRKLKDSVIGIYKCNQYTCKGKTACTPHYIQENVLTSFVINDIRLHAQLAAAERERIARQLSRAMSQNENATARQMASRQREVETRMAVIASNIKHLYEDKCAGKLPEDIFQSLLTDYSGEQKELSSKLEQNRRVLEQQQCTERDISDWLNLIAGYMELKTLDRITVMELIESIEIGESKKESGRREQEITIHYRFIGNLLDNAKEDIA